jgi:hypothetical protein
MALQQHIILAMHGNDTQFKEVDKCMTDFTSDVAVELKHPSSDECAERVQEHTQRGELCQEVNVHNVMGCVEFVADHAKFGQLKMIGIIFSLCLCTILDQQFCSIYTDKDDSKEPYLLVIAALSG